MKKYLLAATLLVGSSVPISMQAANTNCDAKIIAYTSIGTLFLGSFMAITGAAVSALGSNRLGPALFRTGKIVAAAGPCATLMGGIVWLTAKQALKK